MTDSNTHPGDREARVDAIILGYLEAVDAGQTPDRARLMADNPDIAVELQSFFAAHDGLDRLTDAARPRSGGMSTVDQAAISPRVLPDDHPGTIGPYRLTRLLGSGAMGRVYEATDPTGRRVAVKVLAPSLSESRTIAERFRQEGRLAGSITHPRCVFVLAAEESGGRPYLVMELMSGETLKSLVERHGPLTATDAIEKTVDLLDGLEAAHRAGVIHRDMKPANCYLDDDDRVKVGDFGLSRTVGGSLQLTSPGGFVGTPLFASPEQLRGETLDVRSDVYSAAATLYYLLTGRAPFQHLDGMSMVARAVSESPPSPLTIRPELSPVLGEVVMRGLARDRDARYATAGEFRDALMPFLPGKLTFAGVGLRFGAYFLDSIPFFVWGQVVMLLLLGKRSVASPLFFLLITGPMLTYFTIWEGRRGAAIGKWLVGLRVTQADGISRPGWRRVFVRTAVLFTLNGLVAEIVGSFFIDLLNDPVSWAMLESVAWLPLLLVLVTMRPRNGYRALHEVISGTRTIQLRQSSRAPELFAGDPGEHVAPLADPRPCGPFVIRGTRPGPNSESVQVGYDPGLARPVWIRQGVKPSEARRSVSRPTHLRWLATGTGADGTPWDAYHAPPGMTLPELIADRGALPWWAARRILSDIGAELVDSGRDGTRPGRLELDQVWVRPNGSAILLDVPGAPPGDAECRAFLAKVAVAALEGVATPQDRVPRAPIPLYAREPLHRLNGGGAPQEIIERFRADFEAIAERPAEVSRSMRLTHLGVLFFQLSIGLLMMIGWSRSIAFGTIIAMDHRILRAAMVSKILEDDAQRTALYAAANDAPLPPPETLRAILAERQIEARREIDRRLDSLGYLRNSYSVVPSLNRGADVAMAAPTLVPGEEFQATSPVPWVFGTQQLRLDITDVHNLVREPSTSPPPIRALVSLGVLIGFLPLIWIGFAWLLRGGLAFRLTGLALVRRDGRPAGRWRCAGRATLFWLPIVAILWSVAAIDLYATSALWLCSLLQGLSVVVLAGYAVHALRSPARAWHDRLAGTWLVPR